MSLLAVVLRKRSYEYNLLGLALHRRAIPIPRQEKSSCSFIINIGLSILTNFDTAGPSTLARPVLCTSAHLG